MPPTAEVEQQLMQQYQQQGVPPEQAAMMIQGEISQLEQNGVVYQNWLQEADYSIEAGSTRRQDINQQIDASNEFMRQALPVLMGPGQMNPQVMGAAMSSLAAWAKINQMPLDMQQALAMATQAVLTPPPPPMAPPMEGDPNAQPPPEQPPMA
jgi:hypothetical protein